MKLLEKGLADNIKQKKQELIENAKEVRIEYLKADHGNERQVMMDFYLLAPVLNGILHDELTKRKALDDKIKEIEGEKTERKKKSLGQREFFNAIFTGVIGYGNKIVFTYDEFGLEKKVELQNNSMEYGQSGAYQAYKTYEALSEKMKSKISSLTQERMDGMEVEKVKAAAEGLKNNMPRRIASYQSIYEDDDRSSEIEQFYDDFMKAFQNFRMIMGI